MADLVWPADDQGTRRTQRQDTSRRRFFKPNPGLPAGSKRTKHREGS